MAVWSRQQHQSGSRQRFWRDALRGSSRSYCCIGRWGLVTSREWGRPFGPISSFLRLHSRVTSYLTQGASTAALVIRGQSTAVGAQAYHYLGSEVRASEMWSCAQAEDWKSRCIVGWVARACYVCTGCRIWDESTILPSTSKDKLWEAGWQTLRMVEKAIKT